MLRLRGILRLKLRSSRRIRFGFVLGPCIRLGRRRVCRFFYRFDRIENRGEFQGFGAAFWCFLRGFRWVGRRGWLVGHRGRSFGRLGFSSRSRRGGLGRIFLLVGVFLGCVGGWGGLCRCRRWVFWTCRGL